MTLDGFIDPALLVGLAAALAPLRGIERRLFPSTARLLSALADVCSLRLTERRLVEFLLTTTGSSLRDAGVERYARLFANPRHVAAVLAMMAHWDLSPLFRDLDHLATPFLLVAGKEDQAVPLAHQELVLRRLSSAKLEIVGGVGHLLHEERPATIAGVILREADLVLVQESALYVGEP
jgi:magnesium chelatase accessory protein